MTDLFSGADPDPTEQAEAPHASEPQAPEIGELSPPAAPSPPATPVPPAAAPLPDERPGAETGTGPTAGAGPQKPIAPREYYSISEVCDLVGLKPHVLRYWESQFPVLNPSKNRSGNRVYQRKEIKLVLLVQHLLYKEKYTIEGARQRLDQLRRGGAVAQATSQAVDSEMRKLLREELQQLLDVLSPRRSPE